MFEFINLIWLVIVVLLFISIVWSIYNEWKKSKQLKEIDKNIEIIHENIANTLLDMVDDENPIMLNVNQDKLIDKTIEEIERRKMIERSFCCGRANNQ